METIKELENKINDVEETLNNLKAKVKELISEQMVMDYLNNQEESYYNLFNLNDMGIAIKTFRGGE